MKIVYFAADFPYPPMMGGTVDVWRRLKAFAECGCDIMMVSWQNASAALRPMDKEKTAVLEHVRELHLLSYRTGPAAWLGRLGAMVIRPAVATARVKPAEGIVSLKAAVAAFAPDAFWLENVLGAALVENLARSFDRPYFIRSHNIEHHYRRIVAQNAKGVANKTAARLAIAGLKRYERNSLRGATRFFDISLDDLKYWQSQGLSNGRFLPTFVDGRDLGVIADDKPRYDVAYLGSLRTKTNVEGLRWFLREVLPIVVAHKPDFSMLIGGSSASSETRAWIAKNRAVTLVEDVANPAMVWSMGRVLVNPVWSGSGVNIKSVEMLFFDRPLVTTPVGIRGLTAAAQRQFGVASSPEEFARLVQHGLQRPTGPYVGRETARETHGMLAIAATLAEMDLATREYQNGISGVGNQVRQFGKSIAERSA